VAAREWNSRAAIAIRYPCTKGNRRADDQVIDRRARYSSNACCGTHQECLMQSSKAVSIVRRVRARQGVVALAVALLSLSVAPAAFAESAQPAQNRQAPFYSPVPAAAAGLAQIVFFRVASQSTSSKAPANVYVNGELEGSLMPDGYTRFCVAKGTYSMEAYVGDDPLYAGKSNPKTEIDLEAGRTYFIGVSENGTGEPVPYRRADAERLLKSSRQQTAVINRASAVVPCGKEPALATKVASTPALLKFQLDAAVLFDFAQSDSSAIRQEGREELKQIADKIRALPRENISRVVVQGHADPIGSPAMNMQLSKERARTVSHALSQGGIPPELIYVDGLGSTDLKVRCASTGDMAKRIRCNAPNRRVDIIVEGTRSANASSSD
jgi:OOP family OmpA-OmpF porin